MSMMLMAQAFGAEVGNSGKKLVLLKLADNANDKGECWPSYQHVADQCEISRRSAMRYIDQLIEDGWIEKQSRKGPKGNSTNVYIVTLAGKKPTEKGSDTQSPDGDTGSLGGDRLSLGSDTQTLGGGDTQSPGISHSFESVSEPVSEPLGSASADDSPGAGFSGVLSLDFPTKCGKGFKLSSAFVAEMISAYPGLDVAQELRRARLWLIANPAKRKTVRGMSKFLNGWMGRQKPASTDKNTKSRHTGFNEIDYSQGLKQEVPDDVANF